MTLATDHTALLIIDVQRGFLRPAMGNISEQIRALQYVYKTVYITKFYNDIDSNYRKLIKWDRFSVGSDDCMLSFEPKDNAFIIEKPLYTCVDASFVAMLRDNGITDIHICGIDTEICVLKCAVDLFENEFRPYVLEKYCRSTHGVESHAAAIKVIKRFIGNDQVI